MNVDLRDIYNRLLWIEIMLFFIMIGSCSNQISGF